MVIYPTCTPYLSVRCWLQRNPTELPALCLFHTHALRIHKISRYIWNPYKIPFDYWICWEFLRYLEIIENMWCFSPKNHHLPKASPHPIPTGLQRSAQALDLWRDRGSGGHRLSGSVPGTLHEAGRWTWDGHWHGHLESRAGGSARKILNRWWISDFSQENSKFPTKKSN